MAAEATSRSYDLQVDPNNRATEIKIWRFSRPHMRAFHFAWLSFFLAFTGWFALAPLTPVVRVSLGLCQNGGWDDFDNAKDCKCKTECKGHLANANIVSIAGTIGMRLAIGAAAETHGPRVSQASMLIVFSIPLACAGLANTIGALTAARFFIGGMGATFVITQFWTSVMFSNNVVGTANATSAGWGNLGGGFTQIFMPFVFSWFTGLGDDTAWRVAVLVPASLLVVAGVCLFFFSDDVPEGKFQDLYAKGLRKKESGVMSFLKGAKDPRVWILFIVYGGCFGTELVMNNVLATYFFDYFGLSTQAAGTAASLFGLMNLFARSTGGIASDLAAKRWSHRGRHWVFFLTQFVEGIMLFLFSRVGSDHFWLALVVLIGFSTCVQMAEGATYAIVPYIGRHLGALGPVSGIVGAGGNGGAVAWGFIYKLYAGGDDRVPFMIHSFCVIATALLIPLVHYPQFGSMFLPQTIPDPEEKDAKQEQAAETEPNPSAEQQVEQPAPSQQQVVGQAVPATEQQVG